MRIFEIASLEDPRVSCFAGLTDRQLRSRRDESRALMICESARVIECAVKAGCEPVALLMERRHLDGQGAVLAALCGCPVYTADSAVLERLTGYPLTRGLLGAFRRPAVRSCEQVLQNARLVAVLEGIVDATNTGAIFRSAAALGVDAVLLTPTCCDPLSRRGLRVGMGTPLQVPWARIGESPADWPGKGLARLKECGFATAALALDAHSIPVDDPALKAEDKLALVLGTEGDGLAPETIAACSRTVMIPMSHGVDSLNVASAAAVAFWELRKRD